MFMFSHFSAPKNCSGALKGAEFHRKGTLKKLQWASEGLKPDFNE